MLVPAAALSNVPSPQHCSLSGCGAVFRRQIGGTFLQHPKAFAKKGPAFQKSEGNAAELLLLRAGNRCNGGAGWKMGDLDGAGCCSSSAPSEARCLLGPSWSSRRASDSALLGFLPADKRRLPEKLVMAHSQSTKRGVVGQTHTNRHCSPSHSSASERESSKKSGGALRPEATLTFSDVSRLPECECPTCSSQSGEAGTQLDLRKRELLPASLKCRQAVTKCISLCAAILVASSSVPPAQAIPVQSHSLQNVEEIDTGDGALSHSPPGTTIRSTSDKLITRTGSARILAPMTAPSIRDDNLAFAPQMPEPPPFIDIRLVQTASIQLSASLNPHSSTQIRSPIAGKTSTVVSSIGNAASGKDVHAPGDHKPVGNPVEKSLPANSPDLNPEVNANLVLEAWNVVDQVYLDARGKGFDRDAWAAKRDEALKHPIRSRIAAYSVIRGLLGSLNDPYTRFLTPDQFQSLSKFDVSGIGLNMGEVDDDAGVTSLRVLGVVHDSSAHAAGIRQGDELISVAGVSVKGKSAFEATSLIQGPVGQPVTLQLQKPTGEVFEAVVPRGKESQQPVSYKLQKDAEGRAAGYVKLRDFSALAKKGVVEAVQRLREAGAQSFILDLQDNLGGLVQAGIEIARLFLGEGETVVYTVGRTPETRKNVLAQGPALFSAPLLVLVNESTASASEIVAGALRDNCRALLVGNKTYGKGLIQSVYELSDGSALAITVGKYITPGHIDIDKFGIEPDFLRSPGPFNWFLPLPSVKEIESKLNACVPPEIGQRKEVSVASIVTPA